MNRREEVHSRGVYEKVWGFLYVKRKRQMQVLYVKGWGPDNAIGVSNHLTASRRDRRSKELRNRGSMNAAKSPSQMRKDYLAGTSSTIARAWLVGGR